MRWLDPRLTLAYYDKYGTENKLLSEFLPTVHLKMREMASLDKMYKEFMRDKDNAVLGLPEMYEPLDDDEVARQRYMRSASQEEGLFQYLGPRWGPSLSLLLKLVPDEVEEEMTNLFLQRWNMIGFKGKSGSLYKFLKQVSTVAKKLGILFSHFWKFYINLETLGGYFHKIDQEHLIEEVTNWVTGDVTHKFPDNEGILTETAFLSKMKSGLKDFFKKGDNVYQANREIITLDDYVNDPQYYASSGASSGLEVSRVRLETGKVQTAKKTKNSALALYSPKELKDMILNPDWNQKVKVIQKRETGKVRGVVNSDDITYLRMNFVSKAFLENSLRGHEGTTLYMNNSQLIGFWQRVNQLSNDQKRVKLPLDQSHFDWQQNVRMLAGWFDVVEDYIQLRMKKCDAKKQVLHVLSLIRDSLLVKDTFVTVRLENGDETKLKYQKGILSGWRWTALFDTSFNWSEVWCAKELGRHIGYSPRIVSLNAQGDDDHIVTEDYFSALIIYRAFQIMFFDINPSKFFADLYRDEYLRLVSEGVDVSGYAARALTSVLWRNPIAPEVPAGTLRIDEQLTSWVRLITRGCSKDKVHPHMLKDMSKGNHTSTEKVLAYLRTPKAFGGAAYLLPFKGKWGEIERNEEVEKYQIVSEVKNLNGIIASLKDLEISETDIKHVVRSETVSRIQPRNIKVERIQTLKLVKNIATQIPYGISLPAFSTFSLHPKFVRDYSPTLLNFLKNIYIRNKEWELLNNLLITTSKNQSNAILKSLGRQVWVLWIQERLPQGPPVVIGASDLVLSELSEVKNQRAWSEIVLRRTRGLFEVRKVFAAVEIRTRYQIESSQLKLGN
jgi:hypothetical protein